MSKRQPGQSGALVLTSASSSAVHIDRQRISHRTATETLAAFGSDAQRGLASAVAAERLAGDGPNDVPEPKSHPVLRFLQKFWGLSAWMIELIAVLSFILHKEADFVIALALLLVNGILSFLQEQRATAAVSALRGRLRVSARVLRDGKWITLAARELVAGDVIRLRSGDFVPADAQIIDGTLQVNQSALTGESLELDRKADDRLYSGSIVKQGEASAAVAATGSRTYYGRTTELVQNARPKLHIEPVISRIVRWLFVIVGAQVAIACALALAKGIPLIQILPLTLVLLMSAIPVALPVMFTVSMAFGAIELGRHGVLVTRLSAAEDAANLDVLCADKTGTLTMNRLALAGVLPEPGFTEEDLVRDGAAAANEANQDAIDSAFLQAARERDLLNRGDKRLAFVPFSAKTRSTEAVIERSGRRLRIIKGALRTVAAAAGLDDASILVLEARAGAAAQKGQRAIAVARADDEGLLRLVGIALLADTVRPDSQPLIAELRALGVAVKMLTGDALAVANDTARALGIGRIVRAHELRAAAAASKAESQGLTLKTGGFAEVYPEDKFLVVKGLQTAGHVVGMTGDGVNDAPALRQAEVGIAVSSATDVAKGAASVVLTTEGLSGIVDLVKNGRAIYQRVLTWIINKVSRTILKSGFVVLAFLATGQFVISALGMVLLVFMTDFAKIALATDRVRPSQKPESWNIGPLLRIAALLGLLMLAEALGLLALGWHFLGLAHQPGELQTFTFQTLLFFAVFSLVSIRERRAFWSSRPSLVLSLALVIDIGVGALIGLHGLAEMKPIPPVQTTLIMSYALIFALGINDLVKRMLIARPRLLVPEASA
jgi:plasma-membrane proton-efflux P-type ATPase